MAGLVGLPELFGSRWAIHPAPIEHDRLVIPLPLYHCFGMVMGNLGCLTHGATMIYPSPAFEPLAVLQAVAEVARPPLCSVAG